MIMGFSSRCGAEAVEFAEDHFDVFDDVGAAAGVGDIDQVDQQARALDVPQELRAQACAVVRAFDQAGDVGDHEADFVLAHRRRQPRRGSAQAW